MLNIFTYIAYHRSLFWSIDSLCWNPLLITPTDRLYKCLAGCVALVTQVYTNLFSHRLIYTMRIYEMREHALQKHFEIQSDAIFLDVGSIRLAAPRPALSGLNFSRCWDLTDLRPLTVSTNSTLTSIYRFRQRFSGKNNFIIAIIIPYDLSLTCFAVVLPISIFDRLILSLRVFHCTIFFSCEEEETSLSSLPSCFLLIYEETIFVIYWKITAWLYVGHARSYESRSERLQNDRSDFSRPPVENDYNDFARFAYERRAKTKIRVGYLM